MAELPDFNSDKFSFEIPDDLSIDPMFQEAILAVMVAQDEIDRRFDDPNDGNIAFAYAILDELNEEFGSYNLPRSGASVSGRIYLVPSHDMDSVCVFPFAQDKSSAHDELGTYFESHDDSLIMTGIDFDRDMDELPPGDVPRLVFSFITPEELELDPDSDDLDTCLMAYPEDVESLLLERPSHEYIRAYLTYHYPELFEYLETAIPTGDVGGRRLAHTLREFSVDLSGLLAHDDKLKRYLELYIYERLGIRESMYLIKTSGDILSEDMDGRAVSSFDDGRLKTLYVYISRLNLIESLEVGEDIYTLQVASAQRQRQDGGYAPILISGEYIDDIKTLDNSVRYFGAAALREFQSLAEIDRWLDEMSQEDPSEDRAPAVAQDVDILAAYEASFAPGITDSLAGYDARYDMFELPIGEELKQIREWFKAQIAQARDHADELTNAELNKLLRAANIPTMYLKKGCLVKPAGSFTGIVKTNLNVGAPIFVRDARIITGRFNGFIVDNFPDVALSVTQGTVGGYDTQLGIVLRDVRFGDDQNYPPSDSMRLLIPLTGNEVPVIYRLVAHDYFGDDTKA